MEPTNNHFFDDIHHFVHSKVFSKNQFFRSNPFFNTFIPLARQHFPTTPNWSYRILRSFSRDIHTVRKILVVPGSSVKQPPHKETKSKEGPIKLFPVTCLQTIREHTQGKPWSFRDTEKITLEIRTINHIYEDYIQI
jgi:hypothetical protein